MNRSFCLFRRSLVALAVSSALTGAGPVAAGTEGRVAGTIVDGDGNPLRGVAVTIRATDVEYRRSAETNKKGAFTIILLDATRDFVIRAEKEGFASIEEPLDPAVGGVTRKTWAMGPATTEEEAGGVAPPSAPDSLDGPAKAQRIYDAGLEAFNEGDMAAAVAKFEEVAALLPEASEPHAGLAIAHMELGDHERAATAARRVLEADADNVLAYQVLYEAEHALGNAEGVAAALARLEELDPGSFTARAIFNQGVAQVKEGNPDAARERFERAAEMEPELAPAHAILSRLYVNAGELDRAVAAGERALALDPGNGGVLSVLYVAYRALGNEAKVQETLTALRSADPEVVGGEFFDRGVAYFNGGDTADAIAIFQQVLEVVPEHAKAHYMLGLSMISSGDTARGKELLSRFVELAPDDPDAATAQEMIESL